MQGQFDQAPAHTLMMGDKMEKKKPYYIEIIHAGEDPEGLIRSLVEAEVKKVMAKNQVTSYNLSDVLDKHTSGVIGNEHKKR